MAFRNVYGDIIWWQVALPVVVVIIALVLLMNPGMLSFGGDAPEGNGGSAVSPVINSVNDDADSNFYWVIVTEASSRCGDNYCMAVELFTGEELLVEYPMINGRFSLGDEIAIEGSLDGSKFMAHNAFMDFFVEEGPGGEAI
jgi:hypothetical protein